MGEVYRQLKAFEQKGGLAQYIVGTLIEDIESYNDEEIKQWFENVIKNGCKYYGVSGLIRYEETHSFYDKYYNEIEALRHEYEEENDKPVKIEGDLKNFYSWWAFDYITRKIADKLNILQV